MGKKYDKFVKDMELEDVNDVPSAIALQWRKQVNPALYYAEYYENELDKIRTRHN